MTEENKPRGAARYARPAVTRSRLILEAASEIVGGDGWTYKQARVQFREQGTDSWSLTFCASDSPQGIFEVAERTADIGIINPAAVATLAARGRGPFREALPLRALTVIPSLDRIGFAVSKRSGLKSLAEIRDRRFPLRLSLRGHRAHSVHLFIEQALAVAGFTLDDLTRWGGEVRYDDLIPHGPIRLRALAEGNLDAVFDEAVGVWGDRALDAGMRFLSLEQPLVEKLEAIGFRRALISNEQCSKLDREIVTLDFSGWLVFTREDVADDMIRRFCAALEARKERIPWQGEGPLPLATMCRDEPQGPLAIPLHRAAAEYWRERGYLS